MALRCEFCGKEYETDPGKFCDQCGRVLSRISIEPEAEGADFNRCHKCGCANPLENRVCKNCGDLIYVPQIS